ncbi:MAG: hypothetical protein ACE145_20945 [Terriglobia bacterium]
MKRVCAACRKNLGEKCAKCGCETPQILATAADGDLKSFRCPECREKWISGQDGETHGLCESCFEQGKRALAASVALGQANHG